MATVSSAAAIPEAERDRLFHSTFALLISNGVSSVLGVVFWVTAVHLYRPMDVGYGVAEIAAMTLIASIAQYGPVAIFLRFLYASGAKAGMVLRTGYGIGVGFALVIGLAFLTLTGHHVYISAGLGSGLLFLAAILLWVIFSIEDSALIGLRTTMWVPVENISFSLLKIMMLPLLVLVSIRNGVFIAWFVPVIICVIPINYYLFRKVLPAHVAQWDGLSALPTQRIITKVLAGEYLGGLATIALTTLPALFIVGRLGPSQAAYFQTPWLAGIAFESALWSIAVALTAESGARPSSVDASVRRAVRLSLALFVPGIIVLVVGAPYFLRVLGSSYAQHGTRLLQYLVLAVPFMGINVLYVTFARMARRVRRVVLCHVGVSVLTLSLMAVLIGPMGIAGAGAAVLIGQAAFAVVFAPSVVLQYRRDGMSSGFSPNTALVATGVVDAGLAEPAETVVDERSSGWPEWTKRYKSTSRNWVDPSGIGSSPPKRESGEPS